MGIRIVPDTAPTRATKTDAAGAPAPVTAKSTSASSEPAPVTAADVRNMLGTQVASLDAYWTLNRPEGVSQSDWEARVKEFYARPPGPPADLVARSVSDIAERLKTATPVDAKALWDGLAATVGSLQRGFVPAEAKKQIFAAMLPAFATAGARPELAAAAFDTLKNGDALLATANAVKGDKKLVRSELTRQLVELYPDVPKTWNESVTPAEIGAFLMNSPSGLVSAAQSAPEGHYTLDDKNFGGINFKRELDALAHGGKKADAALANLTAFVNAK